MTRLGLLLGSAMLCFPLAAYLQAQEGGQAGHSAGSKEDLSVLAGNMLNHTNIARTDIKKGDKTAALTEVEKAQAELQRIQARDNGAAMVPVYQEFVSVSFLQPVVAEQSSRHGNNNQPANMKTVNNSNEPAVVHQVAGDYTDVAVSTKVAQVNLEAAKHALEDGNLKRADLALADVQDGVSIQEIEANMPLARARENLILARSAAEKGNYSEAHAALASASRALVNYSHERLPHSADANTLAQQITTYDKDVQQSHNNIVTKINEWWNTTSSWTPYKQSSQMASR